MRPICVKCQKEMNALQNGTLLIHYYDNDRSKGIDVVYEGDTYGCSCGNTIVTGFGRPLYGMDIADQQPYLNHPHIEVKFEDIL